MVSFPISRVASLLYRRILWPHTCHFPSLHIIILDKSFELVISILIFICTCIYKYYLFCWLSASIAFIWSISSLFPSSCSESLLLNSSFSFKWKGYQKKSWVKGRIQSCGFLRIFTYTDRRVRKLALQWSSKKRWTNEHWQM